MVKLKQPHEKAKNASVSISPEDWSLAKECGLRRVGVPNRFQSKKLFFYYGILDTCNGDVMEYHKKRNSNNSHNSRPKNKVTTDAIIAIATIFTIATDDVKEACSMVQPCIKYSGTLYDYITMNKKHIIKVREYVKKNHPILRSEVSRYCNLDARQLKDAEDTLRTVQDVMRIIRFQKEKDTGAKGKIQTVYCLYDTDKMKCKNCKYKEYCESDLNV